MNDSPRPSTLSASHRQTTTHDHRRAARPASPWAVANARDPGDLLSGMCELPTESDHLGTGSGDCALSTTTPGHLNQCTRGRTCFFAPLVCLCVLCVVIRAQSYRPCLRPVLGSFRSCDAVAQPQHEQRPNPLPGFNASNSLADIWPAQHVIGTADSGCQGRTTSQREPGRCTGSRMGKDTSSGGLELFTYRAIRVTPSCPRMMSTTRTKGPYLI